MSTEVLLVPDGDGPDRRLGYYWKGPAATILPWLAVASVAVNIVTGILGWFS